MRTCAGRNGRRALQRQKVPGLLAFSQLKSTLRTLKLAVKAKLYEPAIRDAIFDRAAAANLRITLLEHRLHIHRDSVRDLIEDLETISGIKCTKWAGRDFNFYDLLSQQ